VIKLYLTTSDKVVSQWSSCISLSDKVVSNYNW